MNSRFTKFSIIGCDLLEPLVRGTYHIEPILIRSTPQFVILRKSLTLCLENTELLFNQLEVHFGIALSFHEIACLLQKLQYNAISMLFPNSSNFSSLSELSSPLELQSSRLKILTIRAVFSRISNLLYDFETTSRPPDEAVWVILNFCAFELLSPFELARAFGLFAHAQSQ